MDADMTLGSSTDPDNTWPQVAAQASDVIPFLTAVLKLFRFSFSFLNHIFALRSNGQASGNIRLNHERLSAFSML